MTTITNLEDLRKHGQERINAGDFVLGEFLVRLSKKIGHYADDYGEAYRHSADIICEIANEVLCDGQE
jgi:hypothetical protein